jgi:hypothetical protein
MQLPESLLIEMRELAARDNRSVDEFAASALAEKVEAVNEFERLQKRQKVMYASGSKFCEASGRGQVIT